MYTIGRPGAIQRGRRLPPAERRRGGGIHHTTARGPDTNTRTCCAVGAAHSRQRAPASSAHVCLSCAALSHAWFVFMVTWGAPSHPTASCQGAAPRRADPAATRERSRHLTRLPWPAAAARILCARMSSPSSLAANTLGLPVSGTSGGLLASDQILFSRYVASALPCPHAHSSQRTLHSIAPWGRDG